MKLGIVFPQTEFGNDPVALSDYAQGVEEIGFEHLLVYDHVLGADPERPGGWQGPYTKDNPFHEPFVLFGYLAAVTERIELVTAVLILPQRQTALVAKQAAEVDVLSQGRLRLGVGTGWNAIEYEALSENFHDRGKRQEEQVELMRRLWSEDALSYEGKWHRITQAGINPRPERQIPIWFGGQADAALERAARIGDGWLPLVGPNDAGKASVEKVMRSLEAAGRDVASFGIEPQAQARKGDPDRWAAHAQAWRDLGATHMSIATMGAGFRTPDEHLEAARRWREAVSG